MAKKGESKLQRKTRSALEYEIGGVWFKVAGNMFQEPGIEDLLGCVRGLYIGVELKMEKGRLRAAQRLRMRRIIGESGAYIIARSPEEAVYKVLRHLNKHGKATQDEVTRLASEGRALRLKSREMRDIRATEDGEDPFNSLHRRPPVVRRLRS